jgi:hypothetical protein
LESGDSQKVSTCFPCFECMKWAMVWCARALRPDPPLVWNTKLNWKPPHIRGRFAQPLYLLPSGIPVSSLCQKISPIE